MKKIAVLCVLALSVCFGGSVFAEEIHSSLTVSPPTQKIVLIPGETYKGVVSVSNGSDSATSLKYKVSVGSFSYKRNEVVNDDYGDIDGETITNYNQMVNWISLPQTEGSIKPNTVESVEYVIDVPKDAPGGGQYATIMISDNTLDDANDNGNVAIQNRYQVASIIYAEVAGETREEGSVLSNSLPAFLLNNGLDAVSMVKNSGNIHTNAEYTLQVWPLFSDEEVYTNEEKPGKSLIMPGTERYHKQHYELPSIGIYKVKQTVKIFDETSVVERMVIYCPLWLLFIIIFAILLLVIWIVARLRKKGKGRARRAEAESE